MLNEVRMMQTTMGCFPVVVNSVSLGQKKIMKEKSNKQQATSHKLQATKDLTGPELWDIIRYETFGFFGQAPQPC